MNIKIDTNKIEQGLKEIDKFEELLKVIQEMLPSTLRNILGIIDDQITNYQNLDNRSSIIVELEKEGMPQDLIEEVANNFTKKLKGE